MLSPKQIAEQYSRETIEAVIKLLQSDPEKKGFFSATSED